MNSYFFDPSHPKFDLKIVKVGTFIICAVLIKSSPNFYRNPFHDIPNPPIKKIIKPKVITVQQKEGGGV